MAASVKLRPSAKLAVLGLLLDRPSYGYELVSRFRRAFSEQPWQWHVTPQAIYGALNDLEGDDLIAPVEQEDTKRTASPQRHSRQNYRVTGGGARAMRQWLAQPMASNPSHEELLIRLHFGEADEETLREMLHLHAVECLAELERIGAVPALTRVQRLVKEDRRLAVQARLSWIDFARAELRGPHDGPIRPLNEPS